MEIKQIKQMMKKLILGIGITLLISGCCRLSTDPTPAFLDVKDCVYQRTGENICWDQSDNHTCQYTCWLSDMLQNDLDLDTTVKIALLNNYHLKATYQKLGVAQAELVQASLLKNPIFSASLRYENLSRSANIIDLGLVQDFLDILLKPLKTKLAAKELVYTKAGVISDILHVIAKTKFAYFALQAKEQILEIKKRLLQANEATYLVACRLHEAGNKTILSLTVNRSNYEAAKIDVSVTETEVIELREALNVLMGLWGDSIDWQLACFQFDVPDHEINLCDIENNVIACSLDLHMARVHMQQTALEYGIEKTELIFPELTFGPDSEREGGVWFIGPQFSLGIPIFDLGIAKHKKGAAELKKEWNEYLTLAIEIRAQARTSSFKLQNTLKQSKYFQEVLVPLKEQITNQSLLQYNAMQLGVFELLDSKVQEFETKLALIEFSRDYWIARTDVELLLNGAMMKNMNWAFGK